LGSPPRTVKRRRLRSAAAGRPPLDTTRDFTD
jgi:hypothetical protein